MKKVLRLCLLLVLYSAILQAQAPDPTFRPAEIYKAGWVQSVVAYPDGRTLVLGRFTSANGYPSDNLVRFNADGSVDDAFSRKLPSFPAYTYPFFRTLRLMPDGRILLVQPGQFTLGLSQGRYDLVMFMPNGRIDSTFATVATVGADKLLSVAVQPDGKILLSGGFIRYGGSNYSGLVRLNGNGSIDNSLTPITNEAIGDVVVQPDGKILMGGSLVYSQNGQVATGGGVTRLLANGTTDPSFTRFLVPTQELLLQPDGKILVGCKSIAGSGSNPQALVYRLLPNGTPDPGFSPPLLHGYEVNNEFKNNSLILQADGRIVAVARVYMGTGPTNKVVRLWPNGAIDNSLHIKVTDQSLIYTGAVLPGDTLWFGGNFTLCNGRVGSLTAFTSSGLQLSAPRLQEPGEVNTIALQPNGQILIGGSFSEVNGVEAGNVARLHANGEVDTAFTHNCATDASVLSIAPAVSGKVGISGEFKFAGRAMQARTLVAVLLPNGALDPDFVGPAFATSRVRVIRSDDFGTWLVSGYAQSQNMLIQMSPYGAVNFINPILMGNVYDMHVSASGGWLVFGNGLLISSINTSAEVVRLGTPNGVPFPFLRVGFGGVLCGGEQADGRILVGGNYRLPGNTNQNIIVGRYLPNGSVDTTFNGSVLPPAGYALAVAAHPSGRIMVGGVLGTPVGQGPYLQGLLPNGQLDVGFNTIANTIDGEVRSIVVQPDGATLVAGAFQHYNGVPHMGLVRLANMGPLKTKPAQSSATVQVWPVPAHDELQVQLLEYHKAQKLTLTDVAGRPVLSTIPTAAKLTLDVRHLPAGVYLLRVGYADGPVTRRVVVQ